MEAETSTRLLVVDDDAKLCRLIRGYLEPLGYEVSVANDGMAGLELALQESFDAMILDVMMPKLNGFELLNRLRATSNLPVLMLTGLGDEADRISGLEIGADDYLPKPFTTEVLYAAVEARLKKSQTVHDEAERKLAHLRDNISLIMPHEMRTPLNGI